MLIDGKWKDNISCPQCRWRHPAEVTCDEARRAALQAQMETIGLPRIERVSMYTSPLIEPELDLDLTAEQWLSKHGEAGIDAMRAALAEPEQPTDDALSLTRMRLKLGEYDGVDIMRAWIAIDELLRLRAAEPDEGTGSTQTGGSREHAGDALPYLRGRK